MPMEDVEQQFDVQAQIKRYLRLLKERWAVVAVCGIITLLIGVGLAQLWPSSYQAKTLFLLRASQLIDDSSLERSLKEAKLVAQQHILTTEIRSQSRVESVLEDLEWKEYVAAKMNHRDRMIFLGKVRSRLNVRINTDKVGDTMVEFIFSWNDRYKVADFCNKMRDNWIDVRLNNFQKDYINRLERAEVVLRDRSDALSKTQLELEKFDMESTYASMGTLEYNNLLKSSLEADIITNRGRMLSFGSQIMVLETELSTLSPEVQLEEHKKNPDWVKAYDAWKELNKKLKKAEDRYTENNPKLIKQREATETAKETLDDLKDMEYIIDRTNGQINPEYTGRSTLLAQLRPQYEEARETLRLSEERLEKLQASIALLPGIMAERDSLLANIDLAQTEYQQAHEEILPLRDRVNSFQTLRKRGDTWQPESTFKNQAFEILERATPPIKAQNPMGIIIMVVSLFIGVGVGLLLTLLNEILKSTFSSQDEVFYFLKKPVLGAVNRIMTEGELNAIRWRKIVFTSSSFLVIFSIVAIIYICNRYPELIPPGIVEKVNDIRNSLG